MTPSSKHARRLAARTLTLASLSLAAFARPQLPSTSEPLGDEVLRNLATSVRSVDSVMERLAVDEDRLYWDVLPDGVVWTMGNGFKASFSTKGASITPFLGSDAPRNYPVTFSLERATVGGVAIDVEHGVAARHEGANVRFERGAIVETYDLDARSIEQSFDLHAPVGVGDLALRIAFESELEALQVEHGIEFRNERGGLDYTHAVAIDANGEQIEMPATLVDGAIEIVVPAEFLANAAYPVRVDPTVTINGVDVSTLVHRAPDVAYTFHTSDSLIAFERVFSVVDRDIALAQVSPSGTVVNSVYVDVTSDDWTAPSLASVRAQSRFLVAAGRVPEGGGESRVWGRVMSASTAPLAPPFQISGGETGSITSLDVGGTREEIASGAFVVGWTRQPAASTSRVNLRVVDANGAPQGPSPVELTSPSSYFAVSVSQASYDGAWSVVWERETTPTNHDLMIARIQPNSVVTDLTTLAVTSADERRPKISMPLNGTNRCLVAFEARVTTFSAVNVLLVDDVLVFGSYELSNNDGGSLFSNSAPDVECDGSHFLVSYKRDGAEALRAAEVYVISSTVPVIGLVGSVALDSGITGEGSISSRYAAGNVSRRQAIVWSRGDDLYLGRVDDTVGGPYAPLCFGDGTGTQCPCGNNGAAGRGCANTSSALGARLSAAGNALMGGDSLVLTGSSMPPGAFCLFFQGTTISSNGTAFGDGLRCATGTIVRLATKLNSASGASSYPAAGDPPVSVRGALPSFGGTRSYQLWYRNAANFCTSSTFNLSNGLVATFTP